MTRIVIFRPAQTAAMGLILGVLLLSPGCGTGDGTAPTASIGATSIDDTSSSAKPTPQKFNLHPEVAVRTTAGEFTITLDAEHAPLTVDNFLSYVNDGHYQGLIFHQVFDGFVVLGGGYDENLQLRSTRLPIRNEAHRGLKNVRGTVAMARQSDAVDSANSQFFINLADNPALDHSGTEPDRYGYCVFGEVTQGMDVVEAIGKRPVGSVHQLDHVPLKPVAIDSIRRVK